MTLVSLLAWKQETKGNKNLSLPKTLITHQVLPYFIPLKELNSKIEGQCRLNQEDYLFIHLFSAPSIHQTWVFLHELFLHLHPPNGFCLEHYQPIVSLLSNYQPLSSLLSAIISMCHESHISWYNMVVHLKRCDCTSLLKLPNFTAETYVFNELQKNSIDL